VKSVRDSGFRPIRPQKTATKFAVNDGFVVGQSSAAANLKLSLSQLAAPSFELLLNSETR